MKLLAYMVLLFWFCSGASSESATEKIEKTELYGTWKFTYIELFDWNELGIPSDSLEENINITFTKNKFTEELLSEEDGFMRSGKWNFDNKSQVVTGIYDTQTNNNGEQAEMIKGFEFTMKIIHLENSRLEVHHIVPESKNHKFAIPGYGKCILTKIE